jgi:mannose-6-phosphate isomerase-like protein (cupin superfamily)
MNIIDSQSATKYTWGNECISAILVDSAQLSVKEERMPPNTKEHLHFHNHAQQFFYILQGVATFYIAHEIFTVKQHQGIHIEPSLKHYIENGMEQELVFLVISQPSTHGDRTEVIE